MLKIVVQLNILILHWALVMTAIVHAAPAQVNTTAQPVPMLPFCTLMLITTTIHTDCALILALTLARWVTYPPESVLIVLLVVITVTLLTRVASATHILYLIPLISNATVTLSTTFTPHLTTPLCWLTHITSSGIPSSSTACPLIVLAYLIIMPPTLLVTAAAIVVS